MKVEKNIMFTQAKGCWLYIQIFNCGFFFGRNCKYGIRIILDPIVRSWSKLKYFPRVSFRNFKKEKHNAESRLQM